MTRRTREWTRSTCRSRCVGATTTGPRTAGWRPRLPAAWKRGAAGASSSAARPRTRWHRLCESDVRRCSMKLALTAIAVLLLAGPALAAPPTPRVPRPAVGEDLWQVQGKVASVTPREFVVETKPGQTVRVDVTKLSPWTRDAVRPGDQVKLFGVPQKDRRLVANGFIQEVPTTPSAATG